MADQLTIEELQAKLATLEAEKAISDGKVKDLSTDLENVAAAKIASDKKASDLAKENSELKAEKKASAPVTFKVDKGGTFKGIEWEAGTYEFTCPKFTHLKGSEFIEIDVREMENSDDAKTKQLFDEIKAELVASGSGIVRFVEPNED